MSTSQIMELSQMIETLKALKIQHIDAISKDIPLETRIALTKIYYDTLEEKSEMKRIEKINKLKKEAIKQDKQYSKIIGLWYQNEKDFKANKITEYFYQENADLYNYLIEEVTAKGKEALKEIYFNLNDTEDEKFDFYIFRYHIIKNSTFHSLSLNQGLD